MSRSPSRIAALALSLFCLPCAFAQAPSNWQMFGGNPQHSGQNAADTGVPPASLAWSLTLASGRVLSPAVVENGRVFVTQSGNYSPTCFLWARNTSDGTPVWIYDFGSISRLGHPSVAGGQVCVQSVDGSPDNLLWRFDAATGAVRGTSTIASQWSDYWAPTIVGNSIFINGGYYGGLYGFSTAGVQLFFNNQLEQYDQWTPAFDNGIVYTSVAGNLRAHNATTGAIQWTVPVVWNWPGWSMRASPVVGNGGWIYFIAPPALYAVNPITRAVVWRAEDNSFSGTPAVANGMVYATARGTLQARNATTGALLWTFNGDNALSNPPVVGNGGFIYVSSANNTYALDPQTGAQVWTAAEGGWLSIGDGKLFIARASGVLSAYNLTPSAALPPPSIPPPYQPPPIPPPVPSSPNWPTFGGNNQHTGLNAGEAGVPPLTTAWSVVLGVSALSPAVIQDGRVFVSGGLQSPRDMRVWSRVAADGGPAWTFCVGDVSSIGHPSVVNGRVYVQKSNQTPSTQLYCIDAWQGTWIWNSSFGNQWSRYWAPVVDGSNIYINGGYYDGMYEFTTSGSQLWFNNQLEQYDSWSPAVDNGNLYTFIAGNLRSHNPTSGATLWTTLVPWNWAGWSMNTAPVVGGGLIYVIAPPTLYAISRTTQAVVWSTSGTTCSGTPACANGVVYSISARTLQARDGATGALLWTSAGDSQLSSPPIVANGFVYVASSSNVYAVSAATGAQVWTAAGGGWLSIGGGKLYVAGSTGTLTAYRLTIDETPPSVPTLASPASGTVIPATTATLAWNASTDNVGVTGYQVQAASDAQFTNVLYSASSASTTVTTGALPEGLHSWRVRARDQAGNFSAWSTVWTFTNDVAPPSVPAPLSPANGSAVSVSSVPLAWGASSDAGTGVQDYDVEVAADTAFSPLEWSTTQASPGVTTGALTEGPHAWRVRARDNIGSLSAWSAARTFTVDTVAPAGPVIVGPVDGATSTTARPLLTWSAVGDPAGVTYEVEIAASSPISAPLEASVTGLTSPEYPTLRLPDGTHFWRVRAVDGAGNVGPWSATMSFVVSSQKGFYVGLGAGGRGEIAPFQGGSAGYAARALYTLPWALYDSAVGETRPAAADLYGDGRTQLVVGLGRYPNAGGWLAVLSDSGSDFSIVRWLRVDWPRYNQANGETWPACGDIDGDGRDEIVVGMGTYAPAGGWFAMYDDGAAGFASLGWRRVAWSQYNALDGQTRPAVGDLDGDGASEVLVGLGRYPGQGGYVYAFTSRTVAASGVLRVNWAAYNAANGETWPACGDVDADGRDEVCLGLGAYPSNGGWMQFFDDSVTGFAPLRWLRVSWAPYNAASGETRPSLGHMTGVSGHQTVVGLGQNAGANGWVAMYDRAPGFSILGWRRVDAAAYDVSNGSTRPSVGR